MELTRVVYIALTINMSARTKMVALAFARAVDYAMMTSTICSLCFITQLGRLMRAGAWKICHTKSMASHSVLRHVIGELLHAKPFRAKLFKSLQEILVEIHTTGLEAPVDTHQVRSYLALPKLLHLLQGRRRTRRSA